MLTFTCLANTAHDKRATRLRRPGLRGLTASFLSGSHAGVAIAVAVGRTFAGLLCGVTSTDPGIYVSV